MSEKFFPSFPEVARPKTAESPLKNPDNMMKLFLRLQNVYSDRPDTSKYKGAMADTKFADEYSDEEIAKDDLYVINTRNKIEEHNRAKGQEAFDRFQENFAFAEAGQAMIVDRLNTWIPDSTTSMTADRDDLKVGVDFLTTNKNGGHFGTAFDVTLSSDEDFINKKLTKNWENNIAKGVLPVVKYAKDPETGKRGRLLTPKFIIGASADDINAMANAYLTGSEQSLDNHPFRKLFLEQIRVQYNDALDYYENDNNKDDARFNLARREYARVKTMIDEAEKALDESQAVDRLEYHEYSKESLTLKLINDFADKKK